MEGGACTICCSNVLSDPSELTLKRLLVKDDDDKGGAVGLALGYNSDNFAAIVQPQLTSDVKRILIYCKQKHRCFMVNSLEDLMHSRCATTGYPAVEPRVIAAFIERYNSRDQTMMSAVKISKQGIRAFIYYYIMKK